MHNFIDIEYGMQSNRITFCCDFNSREKGEERTFPYIFISIKFLAPFSFVKFIVIIFVFVFLFTSSSSSYE